MSDRDFQNTVLSALAGQVEQVELKTEMRNVVARLDKLNGKVADHEARLGQMQIELAERRNQCPLVDAIELRIRPVEDFITAEQASKKTNRHWMEKVWPVIWVGAGVFGFLILEHAQGLLQSFFHQR